MYMVERSASVLTVALYQSSVIFPENSTPLPMKKMRKTSPSVFSRSGIGIKSASSMVLNSIEAGVRYYSKDDYAH